MNIRYVLRQVGLLVIVQSIMLFFTAVWSTYDYFDGFDELGAMRALAVSQAAGAVLGLWLWLAGRKSGEAYMGRREALLLVALSWILGAGLSALPYWTWALRSAEAGHPFQSFVACYFEAMSGLTTTGATVLSDVDVLPRGLLLWRAATHWLGGLGIVVLFVAVLPNLGVGGKKLFAVEAPGPTTAGVRPRIRETARVLWLIYLGLTVLQSIALRLAGMSWFDAVCHTFATLATGGFSTRNASVGDLAFSPGSQWVIIVFMILAGANFGLYYQFIRRRWDLVWRDPELRTYLAIICVAAVIVCLVIAWSPIVETNGRTAPSTVESVIRHGLFQVVSIQTTTGFCTADFHQWSFPAKAVLVTLMFIGASAGSTGGGIKVIRVLIAARIMLAEIERVFRPNVVRTVNVGRQDIDPAMRTGILVYVLGIIVLFVVGAVALRILEDGNQVLADSGQTMNFTTAATAAAATLNNIGPGLDLVGAVENYGWFSTPSLIVMIILMAIGRLEIYAILVLFLPRFWLSE